MNSPSGRTYYDDYWREGLGEWTPRGVRATTLERRLIDCHVGPEARLLDFGCGDGTHLGEYVRGTARCYTGVDISAEAIALCQSRGLQALQCEPEGVLPFPDEAFDAVCSFEVLEHVFRPDTAVQEIVRVLVPGGVFLGSVPNAAFVGNRVLLGLGYFNPGGSPTTSLYQPWADPHIRFFTKRSLADMLKGVGFREVAVLGRPFSLLQLPVLYRTRAWMRAGLGLVSRPLTGAGRLFPSLFSDKLYFVARS
jgi:SAM-dependent methyltransferase